MVDVIEKSLQNRVSKERSLEMNKYRRTKIYNKINKFLHNDRRIVFSLINHGLAIIDDMVDTNKNTRQLDRAKQILSKSFNDEKVSVNLKWEKHILKLGQILSKLRKEKFIYANDIFYEIMNYWDVEKENLNRKGKILNSTKLDKLNLEIGKSIGMQFLYILCPELNKKTIILIASNYGFAIKLVDNLSDLDKDMERGYVNIPKEKIKEYKISLMNLSKESLLPYIKEELQRAKKYYKKGDDIIEEILEQHHLYSKGILMFKDIVHSWLRQVHDVYNV